MTRARSEPSLAATLNRLHRRMRPVAAGSQGRAATDARPSQSFLDAIRASLPAVQSDLVISVDRLNRLGAAMHDAQATFEKTGGLHAAGLFDADGRLIVLREDIGRHNAVDKVIGHMVLSRGVPLDRHVLMVSGRVSFEIMQKALTARIPVIAAVSAPSSMAVQMALAADMTLIGFMRNGGFNLYAGAHRLAPSVAELV